MLARHYQSDDAARLDEILSRPHDVRLDCDRLVCVGPTGSPVGLLVWRPGGIVHELRVGNGLGRRYAANSLVNFAVADAIARPHQLHEAIFVCDSDDMARYAGELGAVEEQGKRIFTLRVRR